MQEGFRPPYRQGPEFHKVCDTFDRELAKLPAATFPNIDKWLENIYTESKRPHENSIFDGYVSPTIGQKRPKVTDSYTKDTEKEIGAIFDKAGIRYQKSCYFKLGTNPFDFITKIYGCVRSDRAVDVARDIAEWSGIDADGKFYELPDLDAHNKLCIYTPVKNLSYVAGKLIDMPDCFHKIPYPPGVGWDGISVVLTSNEGVESFDEAQKAELQNTRRTDLQTFVGDAKHNLETSPKLGLHFNYLKNKSQARKVA